MCTDMCAYAHAHTHKHHTNVFSFVYCFTVCQVFLLKTLGHLIARPSDNLQKNLLSPFNKCRQAPQAHTRGTISHCGVKGPEMCVFFFFHMSPLKTQTDSCSSHPGGVAPSPVYRQAPPSIFGLGIF